MGLLGFGCYVFLTPSDSAWFYYAGLTGRPFWKWICGCLLICFFVFKKQGNSRATGIALSSMAVLYVLRCFANAQQTLDAGVLYKTDHPSFMFRLNEFAEAFPALGGYNPAWNGGVEHFTGVSSGIQGIGLIFLPLLKHFPVHDLYNGMVLLLFLGLVPVMAFFSARAVGGGLVAMACAAILSLGISHSFFLWMWHFGTLGAAFSSAMVIPVLAISYRVAVLQHRSVWTFLGLWASVFLMCMWMPLSVSVGSGLFVGFLLMKKQWNRKSFLFLFACTGALAISWFPWLRIILFPARGVVSYVGQTQTDPFSFWQWGAAGLVTLLKDLFDANPLILLLGLGGTFCFLPGSFKRWYLPGVCVLALFSGWIALLKPLSQFERLIIPCLFALVIPAALVFANWIKAPSVWSTWLRVPGICLLMLSGEMAVRSYDNQGPAPAQCMDPVVPEMVAWIRQQVPENGRLLFAGAAVHAYGGGKIAYLPILTGREMMADDYFGFPKHTIEYNFPPRFYRKDPEKFRTYLHVYNVTHVITSHDDFRAYFAAYPNDFVSEHEFSFRGARLRAYRFVRTQPFTGEGLKIKAKLNGFLVDFPAGSTEAILPYNWREGLHCLTPDAEISPWKVDENIRFIRVNRGNTSQVNIGYRIPWKPVGPNFDGSFHH